MITCIISAVEMCMSALVEFFIVQVSQLSFQRLNQGRVLLGRTAVSIVETPCAKSFYRLVYLVEKVSSKVRLLCKESRPRPVSDLDPFDSDRVVVAHWTISSFWLKDHAVNVFSISPMASSYIVFLFGLVLSKAAFLSKPCGTSLTR